MNITDDREMTLVALNFMIAKLGLGDILKESVADGSYLREGASWPPLSI